MVMMKLHLPFSLRRSLLLALLALPVCCTVAEASVQHPDVSIQTYTDFGQNKGRYVVGNTNALLQYIRAEEGVRITYTGGQADYTLQHGMIDFGGVAQNGASAAIGYNFIATVNHNGVQAPSFTSNELGTHAIRYQGIEYRNSSEFLHKPSNDYKITRLNKIVTDVDGSAVYGSVDGDYSGITEGGLVGQQLYRAGAGAMYRSNEDGSQTSLAGAYGYITGGITNISSVGALAADGAFSTFNYYDYTSNGINDSTPMTYQGRGGDSGSPAWVWNEKTGQYEYLNALQSGNDVTMTQNRGNCSWTVETMNQYNKGVDVGAGETIYLGAIDTRGETRSDSEGNSTTLWSGAVTDAAGTVLQRYNGIESGKNTWADLSRLKDTANWYNYGSDMMSPSYADLFHNDNLVLTATDSGSRMVQLNATVDLGIGYVQFSLAAGVDTAEFEVVSGGGGDYLLNSAGFVVDDGVEVHLQLTNPSTYMREWRKVGGGDLYIEGSGDNGIFLNVGGEGSTILARSGGYAAYNVLVNNSSTVKIADIGQIARDLTFGNRGGVLDMNGQSMVWNNDNKSDAEGFTIHALDEQAIITNSAAEKVELRWTQGGSQTWLGSFTDSASGALSFIYNGGDASRLDLHSIHTRLTHAESGMVVQSGTLALSGTNTEHAIGSLTGTNRNRYSSADDWHYADATTNVAVQGGATFELGSHARLTGNVTVASGGTYTMREGVKHRYEYIEGGYEKEDTDKIRAFFGHKGNTHLEAGATLQVAFSEGTDSTLEYDGDITGSGSVSVDAQEGILKLGGNSSFSGEKTLVSGGLHASSNAALGDTATNKWVIGERGWLASDGFTEASQVLSYIDSTSTGVLALSQDVEGQIDLSGHTGLIIGAAEGCNVCYGTAVEALNAVDGQWVLGGGGGNLEVAFKLSGKNNLVLGNEYGQGNVHLSNTNNDFSGDVFFCGGVTLTYADGAMGKAMINLSYGNRAIITPGDFAKVKTGAAGAMLVDKISTSDIDLSSHSGLALGAAEDVTYSGTIRLADGADYHFGGSTGALSVTSQLEAGRDMVIDGQGYSGGSVSFANAQNFNGHVTLMGHAPARTAVSGNATLIFEADNAMTTASGFTVKNGGIIDLAGTNQQLFGVELAGGSIVDSSSQAGTLTLVGNGTIGSGVVSVAHVVKAGSGTYVLNNSTNNFADFAVEEGTLRLSAAARGTFSIGQGAVLDLNSRNITGSITLGSGAAVQNASSLSATLLVQGEGNELSSSGNFAMKGNISVAEGAGLTLRTGSGSFTMSNSLSGAGRLSVITTNTTYGAVSFEGDNRAFTGTLAISGAKNAAGRYSEVNFKSLSSFGRGIVSLDAVNFSLNGDGAAETAVDASLEIGAAGVTFSGNTDAFCFKGLSGSGSLYVNQYGDGRFRFSGNVSGFGGTLDSAAAYSDDTHGISFGGSGVNYHELTGSTEAVVRLFSDEGACLKSSKGTITYDFCYTDAVELNATVEDKANITQSGTGTLVLSGNNSSSGTLTINSGSVQLGDGGETGTWVGSLAGSGTLINRNSSVAGVSFTSSDNFNGSFELMQGSKISLARDSFSLGAGQHLSVLAGAAGGAATLSVSTLELNGGSLVFSGEAMNSSNGEAILNFAAGGGLSRGSDLKGQTTVTLRDNSYLTARDYQLIAGDSSSFNAEEFVVSGLSECFDATFSTNNGDGLYLTLSRKDGYSIWTGSPEASSWSTGFGGSAPQTTDVAWFNDAAQSKNVSLAGSHSVGSLVFNASDDYTLSATSGGSLSANRLEVKNSGTVTLESGVTINGATTIAAGGEVVVKDFATLNGVVSGEGTLTIDAGTAAGNETLGSLGTLRLASGTYNHTTRLKLQNAIVIAGGQLAVTTGGTYTGKIVFAGGGQGADLALSTPRNGTIVLVDTINLQADATVDVTSAEAQLCGYLDGQGNTLTKTGSGMLWLDTQSGFKAYDVSFSVKEGTLRLGRTVDYELPDGINAISVEQSATLGLQSTSGTLAADLTFADGSTFDVAHGVGRTESVDYTLTGTVNLEGTTALLTSKKRNLTLEGVLTGAGGFSIGGVGELTLVLNNLQNNFAGGIKADGDKVTLSLAGAGAAGTGEISLGRANTTLNIAGGSTGYDVLANAISGAGQVELSSGNLEYSSSKTYTGSTRVKEGAALRLSAAQTSSSSWVVESGAQLVLADGGSLSVGEAVGVSTAASPRLRRAAAEGVLENITVTETAMSAPEGGNMGRVSAAAISIDAMKYTMTNLGLEDSRVELNTAGAELALNDILVGAGSNFSGASGATIAMQNVTLTVDASEWSSFTGSDFGAAYAGRSVAGITLANFSQVALTGTLQLDAPAAGASGQYDYLAVNFGEGVDVSALSVTANFGGSLLKLQGEHGAQSSVLLFATSSQAVPEPAGSTLALLGLGALALRRRRQ